MAKATHRLIFQGSAEQDRTFRMSQIFAAVRALDLLLRSMRPVKSGIYECNPVAVLHARQKMDRAAEHLADERPIK